VFGEVITGIEIVKKIANVPRGPNDRPRQDQVLDAVEVFRSTDTPS
jgi:hypothetical protein